MASVRRQINIAATARDVWAAFTTADGLQAWLATEARIDARAGGRLVLLHGKEGDEERVEERGIVHTLRPTRKIEIMWDKSSTADTAGSRIVVLIARDGDETRVGIVHSASTEVFEDEEQRTVIDEAWRSALLALRAHLEP
jgi:uncharacterized protein YndB with AHSA1/START domain